MKWEHILSDVFTLYFKLLFVYLAYIISKIFIARNRPQLNPSFARRIGGYLRCVAGVAFAALFVMGNYDEDKDEARHFAIDYNRGATVFVTLLIPALLGATEGFSTKEKFPVSHTSGYDDL